MQAIVMNVSLGKTWEEYVAQCVSSGEFNNASEVVRDALRRQQEQLLKLEALRRQIDKGLTSLSAGQIVETDAAGVIARAKARKKT
jgi:antitoxin ParD1/3/4